jgi:hypothetical protein
VVAVEKAGIHAYMALPKHDECGPLLGKDEFTYDAKRDVYICPQGETLHRKGHDYKERSIRYAAKPSACNVCVSAQESLHEEQEGTLDQTLF